jgi:DNA polymerase-1
MEGDTGYVYFKVNPLNREVQITPEILDLKAFFEDPSVTKVFHNARFDRRMLDMMKIKVNGRIEDTIIAAHALMSHEESLGLKYLAKRYVDYDDADEKDLQQATITARHEAKKKGWKIAEKEKGKSDPIPADYWLAPKELVLKYAVGDVERTILLWKMFQECFKKEPSCRAVYERDMQICEIAYKWETRGMRLNEKNVRINLERCQKIKADSKTTLDKFMGYDFNPNSNKHAIDLVYNKLGFPIKYESKKTGKPAVNYKALVEIDHPMVKTFRDWDASDNLINAFESFKAHAIPEEDGHLVVHHVMNPCGTATGRFSSRNPNIMSASGNSRGTSTITDIITRSAFSPRFGYAMFCLDYIAQEIWLQANNCGDQTMLNIILNGGDLHNETALAIWGQEALDKDKREGTKITRAKAKITNFGVQYRIGAKSLAGQVKCSVFEAKRMLAMYKQKYPGVPQFWVDMENHCIKHGYILTPFGRKIWMRRDWGYGACNYSVQGSGADVVKTAIIRVNYFFEQLGWPVYVLLTLHDEMILEIKKEYVSRELIESVMELMGYHPQLKNIRGRLGVDVSKVVGSWAKKVKTELEEFPHAPDDQSRTIKSIMSAGWYKKEAAQYGVNDGCTVGNLGLGKYRVRLKSSS